MTGNYHSFFLLAFLCLAHGCYCFRNVTMTIDPATVENGEHVIIGCHYDLEGAPLYSVKWYRGNREFYRYSPTDVPPKKVFKFPKFHVDSDYSNATQVMLRNVGFSVGGNVSCEVTTDVSFKTLHAASYFQVMSPPRGPPVLHVEKEKYHAMDTLHANCTSQPSKPAATISFYINEKPIGMNARTTTQHTPIDNLAWTFSTLSTPLYPGDFTEAGQIIVTCVSEIDRFYREVTTVRLGPKNGEPVPERVRSPNGGDVSRIPSRYLLLLLPIFSIRHALT